MDMNKFISIFLIICPIILAFLIGFSMDKGNELTKISKYVEKCVK